MFFQMCFTTVSVHILEGSLAVTQAQGSLDERVAGLSKDRGLDTVGQERAT